MRYTHLAPAKHLKVRDAILIFVAGCVATVWLARYWTISNGVLVSDITWGLDSVVIEAQPLSPDEVFIQPRSPQLLFVSGYDYKGTDGCNVFNGYYATYAASSFRSIEAVREITRIACQVGLPGTPTMPQNPAKLNFLEVLASVTQYELRSDELRLHYIADSSGILVFHPSKAPDERIMGAGFPRWVCTRVPFLFKIFTGWCWI